MVEHLGHLVQRPSGISFLRDFVPASFGFFANAFSVAPCVGGVTAGVTAGSELSNVSVFLVKVVVAIGVPYWLNVPRARVQTHTASAPCLRRTFAHALVVAPVVNTSSTTMMRFPTTSSDARGLNLKAPRILSARCARVRRVWVSVGFTRLRQAVLRGTPTHPESCRARASAWLNSRSACFKG